MACHRIEGDETPDAAVKREAMEEAGIEIDIVGPKDVAGNVDGDVEVLISPDHIQLEEIDEVHQHIDLVYFARTKNKDIRLKEDEHHDIKWFSDKDLDSPEITKNVRHFARKAIRDLG